MITLGIDPGTTTTGFALIEKEGSTFSILDYGVIETPPKIDLEQKLIEIGRDISELLENYKPERVSIEKLFFNTNLTTGINVSHARGVILYEIAKRGIPISEYTPLQVKKSVTGSGSAKKDQLQRAIMMIFGLKEIPKPDDAADAIALGYIEAIKNV